MDPAKAPQPNIEQDWDADDFEIPSLKPGKRDFGKNEVNSLKNQNFPKDKVDSIYLGPHGAPPSHLKQQDLNSGSAKKNKQKPKFNNGEKKGFGLGRDQKVDTVRELMVKGNHQSCRR